MLLNGLPAPIDQRSSVSLQHADNGADAEVRRLTDVQERAPLENEAAALVGKPGQRRDFDNNSSSAENTTTSPTVEAPLDRQQLFSIARAVMPRGELRRFTPKWPLSFRRIGADVYFSLFVKGGPDATELDLLLNAYIRALARREQTRPFADRNRALQALLERSVRGERIAPGEVAAILGPVK